MAWLRIALFFAGLAALLWNGAVESGNDPLVSPALFVGLESRGGKGYLTDRAIHFVPNRFVVQDEPWSLALEDLASGEVEGGRLLTLRDTGGAEHWLILQDPAGVAERLPI